VNANHIPEILHSIGVPLDDPSFHQKIFSAISKIRKAAFVNEENTIKKICIEEFDNLSKRLDITKIQESTSVRNILRSRLLSNALIDDKGEINPILLSQAIAFMQSSLYSLGPDRQYDAKRQEQILHVLTSLQENKELHRYLKNIGKPYNNRFAEQIIKQTLQMQSNTTVNDPQAKRAALSAWMCYLRQNVGSCFATAPAILVHDEQPDLMLKDMIELLGTGQLKRTYGGVEYSVPLSSSWGAGDLRRLFVIPRDGAGESSDIWLSPGIIAGLETIGIVDQDASLKERIQQTKNAILGILQTEAGEGPYVVLSAEDILRKCLMKSMGLTRKDLDDYDNRPTSMFTGNLMMQAAAASSGGKTQACVQYYIKLDEALDAFKALSDNALLKSWEFTLASFAETKSTFTSWNLYSSLGLGPQEPGGIGQAIYRLLQEKLDKTNQKMQEFQMEYELAYNNIRYLENRMRSAESEKQVQWLKIEYQSRRHEFDTLEEMRNRFHYKAERFASLFDVIIKLYTNLFPKYFQEVYDADMHEITQGPYDDSPAGFRLVYKHGRAATAQWTRIKSPNEFIEALTSFFVMSESEISGAPEMEGLETDASDFITAIVSQVRTQEFLETAFYRMAKAHNVPAIKDPLEHLDRIDKKPWAYTSGGTMGTLVSSYWKREQKPTDVERWVENPTELLVFFVDAMKQIPHKISEEYIRDPKKNVLAYSPTHAFLLKPGQSPFKETWQSDEFTYTAVRDKIIKPAQRFVDNIILDQEMTQFLLRKITGKVSPNYRYYFTQVFSYIPANMEAGEFRKHIVDTMSKERGLAYGRPEALSSDEIDSLLFSLLPLFPASELQEKVNNIFKQLPGMDLDMLKRLEALWDEIPRSMQPESIVSAKTLQDIVKAFLCLLLNNTGSSIDYHWHVSQAAKNLGYAMPMPVIFADTNWVKEDFGFLVNPGTGKFELWRVDYTGSVGYPMTIWGQWLDGSHKSPTWGLYTRPYEYSR